MDCAINPRGRRTDQVIKCEDNVATVATNNLVKLTADTETGYHSVQWHATPVLTLATRKKWADGEREEREKLVAAVVVI